MPLLICSPSIYSSLLRGPPPSYHLPYVACLLDLIPLILMEAKDTEQCVELGHLTAEVARAAEPIVEGLETLPTEERLGCAKRVGFERGIPVQKIRSFHFWQGQRHPLPGWSVEGRPNLLILQDSP